MQFLPAFEVFGVFSSLLQKEGKGISPVGAGLHINVTNTCSLFFFKICSNQTYLLNDNIGRMGFPMFSLFFENELP